MSADSATNTLFTLRPSGPDWWVTRISPSISAATSRTSFGVLRTCTPPLKPFLKVPLPRPPAWICALTAISISPSSRAICSASSSVVATLPRVVATSNFSNNSLAWYSWMFIGNDDAQTGRVEYSAQRDSATIFLFRIGLRCRNRADYGGNHEKLNETVDIIRHTLGYVRVYNRGSHARAGKGIHRQVQSSDGRQGHSDFGSFPLHTRLRPAGP